MTDTKNKKIISAVLFGIIGLLWRPLFGTSKYLPRFVKYIICAAAVLGIYYFKGKFNPEEWRMWTTCATFLYFWAMAHGMFYNYWDDSDHAEDRKPLLVKFVKLIIGEKNSRTFAGNMFGMFVRYTFTAVLVAISMPNLWFITAGALVAISYAIPAILFKNKNYTKMGEYISGASVFCLFGFLL